MCDPPGGCCPGLGIGRQLLEPFEFKLTALVQSAASLQEACSSLCRRPLDHPRVLCISRRTPGTQHVVVLTAVVYYSEGHKAQSAKGKGSRGKVWGNQAQAPRALSQGGHTGYPLFPE